VSDCLLDRRPARRGSRAGYGRQCPNCQDVRFVTPSGYPSRTVHGRLPRQTSAQHRWGAWVIPEFVETGMGDPALPPGIHKASVDEIRAALVDAFPESTSRSRLLGGWLAFRLSVRRLVPVEYEYLDGSFVTGKLNPKDIDLSLWINRSDLEAAHPDNRAGITTLRRQRLSFGCDALFVFVCPTSHPKYREFEHFRDWTENAWRTYRTGTRELTTAVSKGIH
jgi:hypothetical protein